MLRGSRLAAGAGALALALGSALGIAVTVPTAAQAGASCATGIGISISAAIHEGTTATLATSTAVARAGDTVAYTVTVHNTTTGNCSFQTGKVALKLPNGTTVHLTTNASLASGGNKSFAPVTYTVADANLTVTKSDVVATATVSGKEPETVGTRHPQAVSGATQYTVFVIHPETGLSVSAVPETGVVPLTVAYTITESNTSVDPADVLATDSISAVVVTTTPTCTLSGPVSSDGTAVLLNPGAHWTYACTVSYPTAGGPFAFDVTATGNAGDGREAGTSATDGAPADETASATVTVTKASPTIVTSPQPASGPFGTTLNDQITLSGLVNPSTTAPGTITAELFPPSEAACTGTPAFTDTLTASGNASYTTASNSTGHVADIAGIWHWKASYSGDANNNGATATCGEPVTVAPAPTTTATVSSPTTGTAGTTSFTDTATVTGVPGAGTPAGTVAFTVCGPSTSGDEVCTSTTSGHASAGAITTPAKTTTDSATFVSNPVSPTAVGTYCFSAVFTPAAGSNYGASTDNVTGSAVKAECFTVTQPNFTIKKTDVPGTGKQVTPGQTIPYTLVVKNLGTGTGSATIGDPLPANETLATSPTPVCTTLAAGDTCHVTVTGTTLTVAVSLAASHSVKITFSAVVAANDTTSVVNTATITAGRCVPSTQCSSKVTNPVPAPVTTQTLTPGFWKNHKTATTPLLPQHLGTYVVLSFTQAHGVLSAISCGTTGIGCLAGQLLAAELNLANHANSCITPTLAAANTLLKAMGYMGPGTGHATSAQATQAKLLATELSTYNSDNAGICPI